jgi:uncharacterized membrane protein YoaK (UPF0700 family)
VLASSGRRYLSPLQLIKPSRVPLAVVLALTFGTGLVDAISYFSFERTFTANMTGNIALIGIGLATHSGSVIGNVCAFAGFVGGSAAVGRFIRARPANVMHTCREIFTVELLVTLAATGVLVVANPIAVPGVRYAVCASLAFAMGAQTGAARLIAVPDVNTTVITMTLHDLAAASRPAGGDSIRWRSRSLAVAAILAGAALGTGLDQVARWLGLAVVCCWLCVVILISSSGTTGT